MEDMLTELEQLNVAYARGEVSEEEYQETHAELLARLGVAVSARDDDSSELT